MAMTKTPAQLGQKIRKTRLERGLTLQSLAHRTGLSMRFLSELERGKEGASMGRVLLVAHALGLEFGLHDSAAAVIDVHRFPQLQSLVWQRGATVYLAEAEALSLYEANWRFVDISKLIPRESELIRQLLDRHGNGVMNV